MARNQTDGRGGTPEMLVVVLLWPVAVGVVGVVSGYHHLSLGEGLGRHILGIIG